jgi:hypothetical protein
MRFGQFLIIESAMGEIKMIADEIINQLADEGKFDHDSIMRLADMRLSKMPSFSDPTRKQAALQAISQYVRPEAGR